MINKTLLFTLLIERRLHGQSRCELKIWVMIVRAQMRRCSIILIVPDFLNDTGQILEVDFLLEGDIRSLGRNNDIVDHVAYFHRQLVWFVYAGGVVRERFGLLSPFVPLLVPLDLMLHTFLKYNYRPLAFMDEQVEIQMGDYAFTEKYCIGQGSYGKVYRGRNVKTGRQVAIKEMDNQLITQQEISREIMILKHLKHPNIVEYEDAFQNGGYFYIVTQYCNGGDLRNLLDSDEEDNDTKEKTILEMFWQICEGFKYLRKFDIIHRDLKPSNILIHNGGFKIADFGLAKRQNVHKSVINQDLMGVPVYMSPQILSKNYYTYKCDVWSMGIIVYEMLFDYLPWKAQDVEALFFQIMNHPRPFSEVKEPHGQIFDVIFYKTLAYLQKERASWDELLEVRENKSEIKKSSKNSKIMQKIALFLNKINPSIKKEEAQILNHIYSQGKSLEPELIAITNEECLNGLFSTIEKFLMEGPEIREMLRDCCFIFLKLVENNLYIQLMEYEKIEQSRDLLVFLELMHDYVHNAQSCSHIDMGNFNSHISDRNISQYAASVISKLSTLFQNDNNQNFIKST